MYKHYDIYNVREYGARMSDLHLCAVMQVKD
jgi:hypothetical protein